MSWSGILFNLVVNPNKLLVVTSEMVRAEVNFKQENLLKKPKKGCQRVPGSIFFVEKLS